MSNQQYSRDTENIHKHLLAKPIAKKKCCINIQQANVLLTANTKCQST